jgi:ATP-dependent helicase/nuclease subunit A
VRKGPVCEAQLSVNFRSTPELITWMNAAFDAMLGATGSGPLFNPETGSVCNLSLTAGRGAEAGPSVHILPFGDAALKVDESRDLEGEALARYLRWLVEENEIQICDPHDKTVRRPARYGDIAVLMVSTQTVHHLLDEMDKVGVPHVVRGGTLFMQDALHRQFLLALRALSDRQDGVAEAALMRPPFFALGLDDLVRDRMKGDGEQAPDRLREARELISALRIQRHQRRAGETARALLEQSGFGCYVAASENGAQRLARLYELCLALDLRARETGLDFDGITALAREWLDRPIHLEAPLPVDADAVQVITVHQAKGLEWPIVALWDGRASRKGFLPQPALSVDATSGEWALAIDGLNHDPSGRALRTRELRLLEEERKRVAYVAVTRARDLLIVPEAGVPKDSTIPGQLLRSTAAQASHRINAYQGDGLAWWSTEAGVSIRPMVPIREDLDAAWLKAARAALEPVLVPAGVSTVTHAVHVDEADEPDPMPKKDRTGRYGPVFGSTVHRALELVLTKCAPDAPRAVQWAAREVGLEEHLTQAEEDVTRTLAALESAGLLRGQLALEYPIAGSLEPSTLLAGYIDLLIATDEELIVVDFKTDDPPAGDARKRYPGYAAQVGAYAKLLQSAGMASGRRLRQGLLFTGDGGLRWVGE